MSTSHEHTKALNDLAQHTGDSTNDRLERLKRIEQLRLQGYQKVKSLTEGKSGISTSPKRATRRSYTSFSPETSPNLYGSLGRIDHLGGVKPKSYSSVLGQTESLTQSQRTRSSSMSDDEGDHQPKHLLRSRSATTVSDTGLSTFQMESDPNMSYPIGSGEDHSKERKDSYNEEDENIEDFKRSLFGGISSYTNKTSPRTDGTLQSFSLSRAWSSGGADYEDPLEGQGHQEEATEDFSTFPSQDTEYLGMNYGESFESPHSYGSTIRKSFSRERSRQPLLRSFSSHQESMPGSSPSSGYSTSRDLMSDRKTSGLDSALDRHLTHTGNTDRISSYSSERENRIESALDSIFSSSRGTDENSSFSSDRHRVYKQGGSTRNITSMAPRFSDRYTPRTDSSYSRRETAYTQRGLSSGDWTARTAPVSTSLSSDQNKIGISAETESKLDQLFGSPAVLSNRPSLTSRSLRTRTPTARSQSERITITRRRTEDPDVRKLATRSTFDQTRDSSFRVPDVLSTRMFDDENRDIARCEISEGPDVTTESALDQKLDSIFRVPDVLSTRMFDNENNETTRRQVLSNKQKPTISSMLYGTEISVEPSETTKTERQQRQYNVRRTVGEIRRHRQRNPDQDQQVSHPAHTNGEDSTDGSEIFQHHGPNDTETVEGYTVNSMSIGSVDVDSSENEDMVIREKSESLDQVHVMAIETLPDTPVEIWTEEVLKEEEIGTEEIGIHGDGVVTKSSKQEEIERLKTDLLQGSETVDIKFHHNEQQSTESVKMVHDNDIIEREATQVTEEQQNPKSKKGNQADSKKSKSKRKKSKGKKRQKGNGEKVAEKEITKTDSGKQVLETDIDSPLSQVDQQNVHTRDYEATTDLHAKPLEEKTGKIAEGIQTDETKSDIQAENEEEERYIQAEEETEKYIQAEEETERYIQAEDGAESYLQAEKEEAEILTEVFKEETAIEEETNVESETVNERESKPESQGKSPTENASWLMNTFNSLLHGFSTDSNGNETERDVQQKRENNDKLSEQEGVSTSNGDMNRNVVTLSDASTVSEEDYATASDEDTTKPANQSTNYSPADQYTNYSQRVQDSNVKNKTKSTEISGESDAMDIFSELAATTGMSLDRDDQTQHSVDVEGHIVYKREEELLRCEKDETHTNVMDLENDGHVDVEQQEIYMQSDGSEFLYEEVVEMKELDFKYEENGNEPKELCMKQGKKTVTTSDTLLQMDVKLAVCTTEMSAQTDVEECLTADKVSASVQTLSHKVDKWTQTDTQLTTDSKELGIQTTPTTADYSAQYNVSVKEFGIQVTPTTADYSAQYNVSVKESSAKVVNKHETEQGKDEPFQSLHDQLKTENVSDQGKPEHVKEQITLFSLEQKKSEYLLSEQALKRISSEQVKQEVKQEHLSSEQLKSEQLSSEQVKLEHLSSEQLKSEQLSSEQVKPEHLSSEQLKSEQLSSEQVKPEHLLSEQLKPEHLSSEQLKSEQLSSEQVKPKHLSSEQLKSEQLSSEQVKSEHLSSEQVKPEHLSSEQLKSEQLSSEQVKFGIAVGVNPTLIVTDKITPEYAVAEQVKIERVVPEQVKLGGGQMSGTSEDISVMVEDKEDTVINEYTTTSSEHMKEELLAGVDQSRDLTAEVSLSTDVTIQNSNVSKDIKVTKSVDGVVDITVSETWSNINAAPSEITFSSQCLGIKVPPQPFPKRRTRHGSAKPSSRPSSIVSEGDGFNFYTSGQNTANLESSNFNFNKILSRTEAIDKERTEVPPAKNVGLVTVKSDVPEPLSPGIKSDVPGPLSPGVKEFGKIPTGSSSTILNLMVGPKSPRVQEHSMSTGECVSATASSNVTSPRSSLSGMSGLGSHGNKGNMKSPPPALFPKRKATSQLQMPTSPKPPTSPRSPEKLELMQEYDPVFAKQMKMNNGKQEIMKEPINRLKDNPFIRKDVNVKMGRQESFSKKCEMATSSKPRTLSSSLTPKSPKDEKHKSTSDMPPQAEHKGTGNVSARAEHKGTGDMPAGAEHKGTSDVPARAEHKGTGDVPAQAVDDVTDLTVLDSVSLRSEIIRQSTSRSSMRNLAKTTKKVENIRSKLETSSDSSVRNVSESSSMVNKIISDAAKFEARFGSGSSPNDKEDVFSKTNTVSGQTTFERDNPFTMPAGDSTFSREVSRKEKSVDVETVFDGEEVQTSTVIQTDIDKAKLSTVIQTDIDKAKLSKVIQTDVDKAKPSTVIQTDHSQHQELEDKMEPPQRKRKLKVQVPPPATPEEDPESEDIPDSLSLASLVASQLEDIGVGEIAGLTTKPDNLQTTPTTGEAERKGKSGQHKTAKPPSPKTSKPPSPKTSKPPSPKTSKPPSPQIGKPPSPGACKSPPPRHNRSLSPKVGKTPSSPRNCKSPTTKLTTPSSPKDILQKSPSTPPSPGGKPLPPRVRQSPLSKAMFGDKENGKPGSETSGDSRSGRRSHEKADSISSRTSSVSSEGSSSPDKGKSARQESSKSRQKGSKETPPVPDKPEESPSGQKGTKKAPPVPEKPKRTSSLKKDKHSHLKDTESSASKSKGKSGFSFLKGRKSSK